MKRQINFNRLRAFLGLACILLIGIYQPEINRSAAAESKPETVFVNVAENSALQTSPCGCKDKKEMLYRVRDIQAIIAEYKRQIIAFQAANTKYSLAAKVNLEAAMQTVTDNTLATEPAPKPNLATAATDGHSCNITFKRQGTPCLAEATRRHELHHSKVCDMNKPTPGNPFSDYRDGMTMAAYAQEEIEGYTIEMKHLQAELGKLSDKCNTSNWYLSYIVQVRYTSPPSRSNNKERGKSSKTWDIDHTYSAEDIVLIPSSAPPAAFVVPDMTNMNEQQRIQALMQASINQANQPTPAANTRQFWSASYPRSEIPMDVKINDKLIDYLYEECKGDPLDYIETTETTKTWDGSDKDKTTDNFRLEVNIADRTYNVSFPIMPTISYLTPVTFKEKTVRERNMGAPPPTEIPKPPQKLSFQQMGMVTVKGSLENGVIHHSPALVRDMTTPDVIGFDSGWAKATAPLPPEWKELEGKLEVKIYYRLTKLPAKQ